MKKFFQWMKDTGGIASWIALPIILGVFVIVYGSVIANWPNFYSQAVHRATGWWHLIGWLLTAAAIGLFIRVLNKDNVKSGDMIAIGVALAFSWCAFEGFNFNL